MQTSDAAMRLAHPALGSLKGIFVKKTTLNLITVLIHCACVLACLAFPVSTAHAEWSILTLNREKTVTIWVESASMQRRGDYLFAWVIYDRDSPAEDGAMSSKALNQYDCENRRARTWRQSLFLKSMAGGEKLPPKNNAQCEVGDSLDIQLDDQCAQSWKPILERTTGADILRALCIGKAV